MKMKISKIMIVIFCLSMFFGYATGDKVQKQKELRNSDVTLITKVLPHGEVGYAIACDFGVKVDSSKLSKESFQIESAVGDKNVARTVTNVYTNDVIEASGASKPGRYVIIELNPDDENAGTLTYNEKIDQSIRNNQKYYVTIKKDVKTLIGVTFKASDKKVSNGKEVAPVVENFKSRTYRDSKGNKLNYRLFKPEIKSNEKCPLVIFLHGSGERGSDNSVQILSSRGAMAFAEPEAQKNNPCYILAPQAPHKDTQSSYWCLEPMNSMLLDLIKQTINRYNIDINRIYITGLSNGGDGVWNLLEKNPKLFAAGVPMCGVVDSNYDINKMPTYAPVNKEYVKILKDIPIWVFQAADDPAVDIRNSREIVSAIKEAGGNLINFTEYPEGIIKPVGHLSWVKAYENKDLIDWLFKQSRNNN